MNRRHGMLTAPALLVLAAAALAGCAQEPQKWTPEQTADAQAFANEIADGVGAMRAKIADQECYLSCPPAAIAVQIKPDGGTFTPVLVEELLANLAAAGHPVDRARCRTHDDLLLDCPTGLYITADQAIVHVGAMAFPR